MDRKRQKLNPEKMAQPDMYQIIMLQYRSFLQSNYESCIEMVSVGSPGTMADSCCIAELKEAIEKMNAELIQSHTTISELNAKVREQEEGQKEMRKLREENAQLARALKESEEKCRAVQERLELAEQRLAQFSQKADATAEESLAQVQDGQGSVGDRIQKLEQLLREKETELIRSEERCRAVQESLDLAEQKLAQFLEKTVTTAEECLAQVNESSNDALDINSLPDEIIEKVFGYLTQNELGQIARVCRRWNALAKSGVLWRKVNVEIILPSDRSENITVKSFINGLPSCVTFIRLYFSKYGEWIAPLDFEELCPRLQEKCPHLEELILSWSQLSNSLSTVIDLCTKYLQNVKNLIFQYSHFRRDQPTGECFGISKIEMLELCFCAFDKSNKPPFTKMPYLKHLHVKGGGDVGDSWIGDDGSFFNQLHVLHLTYSRISSRTFSTIQDKGLNLRELYFCGLHLLDGPAYLTFTNSAFPHLETICISNTDVTCESVVFLIQSHPSLQNVYVDRDFAESFEAHPFVLANRCKSGILKAIDEIHKHNVDYSHT